MTAAECMLLYEERGKEMMNVFKMRINRIHTDGKKYFESITKWKCGGFSPSAVKPTITVNRKIRNIIVERGVLDTLVADSHKKNSPVNIDEALSFPLRAVSQPLATADKPADC